MVWLPDHIWKKQQGKKGGGKGWGGGQQMVMVPLSALKGIASGGKGGKGGKGAGKRRGGLGNSVHPDKKVWIGGLKEFEDRDKRKEASKKLQEFIKKKGADCKFAEIWPKGVGVATFISEEEAQSAISTLSGAKFMGKTLEVDTWERKPKEA